MVQGVKCLPHKPENLNSDPTELYKSTLLTRWESDTGESTRTFQVSYPRECNTAVNKGRDDASNLGGR